MHVKPIDEALAVPRRPQLHSATCHSICTYNGTGRLPKTAWVRSPTVRRTEFDDCALVYEIILYYSKNRACTIYRTWDDFVRLRSGLPTWKNAPYFYDEGDVRGMHKYLHEALKKCPKACAIEYFLRRRIEDCGSGL